MEHRPSEETDPETGSPGATRPARYRWQVGLRGLGLLILVSSVWMADSANRRQIPLLRSRILTLKRLAREVIVDDPAQFAAVMRESKWHDEHTWEVYLPEGTYRLCLATRGVASRWGGVDRLDHVVRSVPIGAGLHRIDQAVKRDPAGWKIFAEVDRGSRIEVVEPKEWDPGHGPGGELNPEENWQSPVDQPLVLFRARFSKPGATRGSFHPPDGPSEGVLIWIERAP